MKNKFSLLIFALSIYVGYAQIGINTPLPNPNTYFHVSELLTTNQGTKVVPKGIMIPRLTVWERDKLTYVDPIATAKVIRLTDADNGLLIFNTTYTSYDFWSAPDKKWKQIDGVSSETESGPGDLGPADFKVDCANIIPHGTYMLNESVDLDPQYYMSIKLIVSKPGKYTAILTTEDLVGVGFTSSGVFNTAGEYTIRVKAQGTPLLVGRFEFNLKLNGNIVTQNGTPSEICKPSIEFFDPTVIKPPNPVITKTMRLLTLARRVFNKDGSSAVTFGYPETFGNMITFQRQLALSANNFGSNDDSFVKFPGWADVRTFEDATNGNTSKIIDLINGTVDEPPVDIIIIHHRFNDSAIVPALKNFLDKGGVVLMYSGREAFSFINQIMSHVFTTPPTFNTATINTSGLTKHLTTNNGYAFSNIIDPILIGPSMDIRNTYWFPQENGKSSGSTYYFSDFLTNLDETKVNVLSREGNNIFAFRHKNYNLFWMGSDLFISNSLRNFDMDLVSRAPLPAVADNISRYGSFFYLNTIAWALDAAQSTGINSKSD